MRNIKHGHCKRIGKTSTYYSWRNMINRVFYKKCDAYKYYGGRNISICKRWLKFENFLEDMGEKPNKKSLDRINNNKGYYKENCKWSTHKEQCNNRRSNVVFTFNNESLTLMQWSEKIGIKWVTLQGRLFRKWSIEKTLTAKTRSYDNGVK